MDEKELSAKNKSSTKKLSSLYGTVTIDDPLVIELIESPPLQRLHHVHQYGSVPFVLPTEAYSRFDHSFGVYLLLKKAGRSREELIAGLLHDVSHTVFSHVGDYVFEDKYPGGSYQDDIHLWYLEESGIAKILEHHGMKKEDVDHKSPKFRALDQPLPALCADRIEYNLQGGYLRGLLSKEDFFGIYQDLTFSSGNWYFQDFSLAKKLALCSLKMTETLWGSAWEALLYRWTAEALLQAFRIQLISFDEFHFSTDSIVWEKLKNSDDPLIIKVLKKMQHVKTSYTLTDLNGADLVLRLKFRGIDPLIQRDGTLVPLTHFDSDFYQEFQRVNHLMESGWGIKFAS